MNETYEKKEIINNEYDYSNALITIENLSYLIQYCDQLYKQLTSLILEDEEKNKPLKLEYRNYTYKKSYNQDFEIYIRGKGYNQITCKDYETFASAVKNKTLVNVNEIHIKLALFFRRGKESALEEHENDFIISIKPYDITLMRKANYRDPSMDLIENQLKSILNQFPVANTIFCDKRR